MPKVVNHQHDSPTHHIAEMLEKNAIVHFLNPLPVASSREPPQPFHLDGVDDTARYIRFTGWWLNHPPPFQKWNQPSNCGKFSPKLKGRTFPKKNLKPPP